VYLQHVAEQRCERSTSFGKSGKNAYKNVYENVACIVF